MSLASKLAFQFDRRVQFKGVGLFNARLVRVSDSGPAHLYGEVMGGSAYDVRIRHDARRRLIDTGESRSNDHDIGRFCPGKREGLISRGGIGENPPLLGSIPRTCTLAAGPVPALNVSPAASEACPLVPFIR